MTEFQDLLASRRSIRDFKPDPIAPELLQRVLQDACHAPSWGNTRPYRIAVAQGPVRDRLAAALSARYAQGVRAQKRGPLGMLRLALQKGALPDGDFKVNFKYPLDLQAHKVATGKGLYGLLGIGRADTAARDAQMGRNFEFFGAPTALFLFVHAGLHEFAVLDAGIWLQTLMLSAQSHGLSTCAQGALAIWGGPVRAEFDVPKTHRLMCGVSIGFASDHRVNQFNPGRRPLEELLLKNGTG